MHSRRLRGLQLLLLMLAYILMNFHFKSIFRVLFTLKETVISLRQISGKIQTKSQNHTNTKSQIYLIFQVIIGDSCIHSFTKKLRRSYWVLVIVLGERDAVVRKTYKFMFSWNRLHFLVGKKDTKNKLINWFIFDDRKIY